MLTTSQGHPIDSKTSTLTIGEHGPVPLQDHTFLDEMAHFDHERIPERVVHAKGAGVCMCIMDEKQTFIYSFVKRARNSN